MLATIYANRGILAQQEQSYDRAKQFLLHSLRLDNTSSATWNNYGNLLWQTGFRDRATVALESALEIDPNFVPALINLGNVYYERGNILQAEQRFTRVAELRADLATGMKLRTALMSKPIMSHCLDPLSFNDLHRGNLSLRLDQLLTESPKLPPIQDPVSEVERLPFYWVYHGLNEYENQQKLSQLFRRTASDYFERICPAPSVSQSKAGADTSKYTVGFISKFWHEE